MNEASRMEIQEEIKKKTSTKRSALIVVIENCDGIICSECSRAKHTFEPFHFIIMKYDHIFSTTFMKYENNNIVKM